MRALQTVTHLHCLLSSHPPQGRESWKYAWALDTTDEERAKGKTQECGRGTFETETRSFSILDAPGHKHFVPHMIGGASQADIAVLVISARKGEFETGFEKGGQTREHAVLAKTAGVRTLIVAINKMDDPTVSCDSCIGDGGGDGGDDDDDDDDDDDVDDVDDVDDDESLMLMMIMIHQTE